MNWRIDIEDVSIAGLDFKCTCPACPEQYDVFRDGRQVAYIRLRHGGFCVEVPDCGGQTVYYSEDSLGDGQFEDDERMSFLTAAAKAILESRGDDEEPTR